MKPSVSILTSVFLIVCGLFCTITEASIYDDFSGDVIDSSKWTTSGTPGLFSQSESRLRFFCNKDEGASLVSTASFSAGFFRIEFYDFYSTNDAPAGRGKKHFSELLSRVAYGGERITIAKRGKPLAMLVPPALEPNSDHLSRVEGWLEDSDPFFKIVNQTVQHRQKHLPRVLKSRRD